MATDEFLESIERLKALQSLGKENGHGGGKPNIDPTANVLEALRTAVARQDDLREQAEKYQERLRVQDNAWQTRFDVERQRADTEARRAEAGRIDSLRAGDAAAIQQALSTASTAALALQSQVTTSASTLAQAAAVTKDAQDKSIAALQLIQAQSGGTLSGREVQRTEGRQFGQWAMGLALFGGLSLAGVLISGVILVLRLSGH